MQTRMLTRKITMKQSAQAAPFTFFVYEQEGKEITVKNDSLETLALILKSLNIPAKEIIVLARAKVPDTLIASYNLFLQCDGFISIYNNAHLPMSRKVSQHAANLSNSIMNLVGSTPASVPNIIEREDVENKLILDVDPLLVKTIFATPAINSVTFIPSRPVALVEALGERTLTKAAVIEALAKTADYAAITAEYATLDLLEENRLARLSYYLPHLQKLMGLQTKVLVEDQVAQVIKVFTSHHALLNKLINDELNRETAGLPDTNVWATFKRMTLTPRIKALAELKAKFNLKIELQALFAELEKRLVANTKKAVVDSELVQRVKDNFIRSVQITALTYWSDLRKNPSRDRKTLEQLFEIFNNGIMPEGNNENIAFSSTYGANSFSQIAAHINTLIPSTLKKDLLETFKAQSKEECFEMVGGAFKWKSYVTDANNPELLTKEEKSVEALVNQFYVNSDSKISEAKTSAKETMEAIKTEIDRIRGVVPHVKELYEQLKTAVKKIEDQLAEYTTAINKLQKTVSDQQKKGHDLYLVINKPNALLTELKNISLKAASSKKILDSLLIKIGSASTVEEAEIATNAAAPEQTALQIFKTEFDAKKLELDGASNEGDRQIQDKRIDDLMRENFLRLRVALFDVEFLNKNTTQFLCMGGTTVSLPDGDAIKVPRGTAEMLTELLKCGDCKDITKISLKTIIDTLTAVKLIAKAALNRSDTRMFTKVRKDPIQQFYQQVASLNLNIGSFKNLESSQFTALNLAGVNGNWPTTFENQAYQLDLLKKVDFEVRKKNNISSVTRPLEDSQSSSAQENSVSSMRNSRRRSSLRVS
jgi:hypothetical protein